MSGHIRVMRSHSSPGFADKLFNSDETYKREELDQRKTFRSKTHSSPSLGPNYSDSDESERPQIKRRKVKPGIKMESEWRRQRLKAAAASSSNPDTHRFSEQDTSDSESDVDEYLQPLPEDFEKLLSNRPDEFQELLVTLEQYGVYDLDDLKKIPEEDVEKLDIKPFRKRILMQYIKKMNNASKYDLDESLCEALRNEFSKLSSNRPEEFEKLLDALDQYGAYDLDDLKKMSEDHLEKLSIKPFQRRNLIRYHKKLNGDLSNKDVEVKEKPKESCDMEDEPPAASGFHLDKSLLEAMKNEFKKLSSNRPQEFEKILLALDQYGAYDLDDLKKVPEKDVEALDIKPFQRRDLMRCIKKMNGEHEGGEASAQQMPNQLHIHYDDSSTKDENHSEQLQDLSELENGTPENKGRPPSTQAIGNQSSVHDGVKKISKRSKVQMLIDRFNQPKSEKLEFQSGYESQFGSENEELVTTSTASGQEMNLAASLECKIKAAASQEESIGPDGGCVENFGCKITFPRNAVERKTRIKSSVFTDISDFPQGKKPITPILECKHFGNFNIAAQVEMHSWARPNHPGVQGHLYRKDEESEWEFVKYVALNSEGKVSFSARHFSRFGVFMDDQATDIPGKLHSAKLSTQTFLHCRSNGVVALVCCLNVSKIINDVKSSLTEYEYIYPLVLPEPQMVPHDEKLFASVLCRCPATLRILLDDQTLEQQCEKSLEISDLLENPYQLEYFHLRIASESMLSYKGEIQMLFSLATGRHCKRLIVKEWPMPIPKKDSKTTVHKTEVVAVNYVGANAVLHESSKGGKYEIHVCKS